MMSRYDTGPGLKENILFVKKWEKLESFKKDEA